MIPPRRLHTIPSHKMSKPFCQNSSLYGTVLSIVVLLLQHRFICSLIRSRTPRPQAVPQPSAPATGMTTGDKHQHAQTNVPPPHLQQSFQNAPYSGGGRGFNAGDQRTAVSPSSCLLTNKSKNSSSTRQYQPARRMQEHPMRQDEARRDRCASLPEQSLMVQNTSSSFSSGGMCTSVITGGTCSGTGAHANKAGGLLHNK